MVKLWKHESTNIGWIILSSLIYVIGMNVFLIPTNVFSTGTFGFAQELAAIIKHFFGIANTTGIIYLILNILPILLGWFKVGKRFTLRSLFCVISISIFTTIIPSDNVVVTDMLLSIVTSAILVGGGIGLLLRKGSSSGGVDIIALYLSLFKGKSFGLYNLLINSVVIFIAVYMAQDLTTGVYMLVHLYILSLVANKVHNANEKVALFIVTSELELVKTGLHASLFRGLTIFESSGAMSGRKNHTIMSTIEKGEIYQAIEAVKNSDPNAFITIHSVENVVGYFENNYKNLL